MRSRVRRPRHHEEGSAYIVTLLALVVLTIVGLSLSITTQSELQIGANERTTQRTFYAADSGISVSTARALVSADYRGTTYETDDKTGYSSGILIKHAVEVTAFYPILDAPCNLCEINNAGTYAGKDYRKINHAVTSTARRQAGPADTIQSQKTLSKMVDVQPWLASTQAYAPINDPAELEKIRF